MENLKIRVSSADESKKIQNILESKGFKKWEGWSELGSIGGFIWTDSDMTYCDNKIEYFDESPRKEITLPELRAMVNPMKEYLDANCNYEFVLSNKKYDGFIEIPEGAIRARFYPNDPDALEFEGDFCQWWHDKDNEWINYENYSNTLKHSRVVWQRATHPEELPFIDDEPTKQDLIDLSNKSLDTVLNTDLSQPMELEYTKGCSVGKTESINDQYAEIEQVRQAINKSWGSVGTASGGAAQASGGVDATLAERQSTYGCFEDVAFVTENIMSILAKVRPDGLQDLPYAHRMALYMIASKMARIVNGDPEYLDNWHDIGGYAKLIEKLIKGE